LIRGWHTTLDNQILNGTGNSGEILGLTNTSGINSVTYTDAGRVYNMVSGSAGTVFTGTGSLGRGWTPDSGSYGWFLPDIGVILLNGLALDGLGVAGGINLSSSRASDTNTANNPAKIVNALNLGKSFKLEQSNSSKHIECNLSLNSEFISRYNSIYDYYDLPKNIKSIL
jgi:hypothetical protein